MANKMNVILDNEWILVKNDWEGVAQALSEGLGVPKRTGKDLKQSFRLYDKGPDNPLYQHNRGLISADEFWKTVLESPGYDIEATPENIQIMADSMAQLTTDVDPAAVKFVEEMYESGVPLFMLSNSTIDINRGNRERNDYFKLFKDCQFSFQTGFRKPEAGAYLSLMERNGLVPQESLFVDDKEENLVGARAVGMQAVYHKIGDGNLADRVKPYL